MSGGPPLFMPGLFLRVLIAVLLAVLVGFIIFYFLTGPIGAVDITGTLVCAPIVAYLIHLWVAPMGPIDDE